MNKIDATFDDDRARPSNRHSDSPGRRPDRSSDANGGLWLSGNQGLSRFDPDSGSFSNFTPADGLQGEEYNFGAAYRSPSGEIFFGGVNLDQDDITYDYFLVRNSGEFLVKGRGGSETELLVDWTPSYEIRPFTDVTETSVTNRLAIVVGPEEVAFEINGIEVKTLPRQQVNTAGAFGLRINHFVNVHVSSLTLTPREDSAPSNGTAD